MFRTKNLAFFIVTIIAFLLAILFYTLFTSEQPNLEEQTKQVFFQVPKEKYEATIKNVTFDREGFIKNLREKIAGKVQYQPTTSE